MDINTQNSSGMMNGMPPTMKEDRKIGPIIGALVVVVLLIIVALYFFGQRLNSQSAPQQPVIDTTNSTNVVNSVPVDENAALQQDLDSQLKDIDSSF